MTEQTFNPVGMDASLDDIEDLPVFRAFPSGAYRVLLEKGIEQKIVNEKPAFDMAMTLKEIIELKDKNTPESNIPKPGDVASLLFMCDNPIGAGKLKQVLKPIQEHFNTGSKVGEIVAVTKGIELIVVLKYSHDKDKDKEYNNIVELAVA